jgi:hypothetical protein
MNRLLRPLSLCLVLAGGVVIPVVTAAPTAGAEAWPIIVRRGDVLYEGDQPFRFFGLAAPNLHQNEAQILPDFSNRFPDEFETRDVLRAMHQMGARATRCFGLSIVSPKDQGIPVYITGRRAYNEAAFRTLDRVLALCHEYDVRVIIPLIISQHFSGWRGVEAFAALAGKTGADFWMDETVKADFRDLIEHVVNRRNTVNGLLYRDDPAILAWQTGNELTSYAYDRKLDLKIWMPRITAWTVEMAAYLKKVDPNHLVMEGGGDQAAFLADPNIDVISIHLYQFWAERAGRPADLATRAKKVRTECRGKKPLIVDEFGLGSLDNLQRLMREIREDGIVGGLLWGIRGHRRDGGFFYHNEGGTPVNSYHWPGFAAGHAYDEQRLLDLLRREAYAIRGEEPPPLPKPSPAPVLLRAGPGFTWRGSTGASCYTLERAVAKDGPWQCLATGLQDSVIADVRTYEDKKISVPDVLYVDESALLDSRAGQRCFYRLKAANAAGESDYCNVVECTRE